MAYNMWSYWSFAQVTRRLKINHHRLFPSFYFYGLKESVNKQFIKRNLSNAITFAYKATQKETESHDTYHTKSLTHIDNVPCAIKIS